MLRYSYLLIGLLLAAMPLYGGGGDGAVPVSREKAVDFGTGFFENRGQILDATGQAAPQVRYYARFGPARVYVTPQGLYTEYRMKEGEAVQGVSEATGGIRHRAERIPDIPEGDDIARTRRYRIGMLFEGCNSTVRIESTEQVETRHHFYLAHCPDGITDVPGYRKLRYRNLYDNIDLVLYAAQEGLKYEFEVRPGGRVSDIRLQYTGAEWIEQLPDGGLHIHWPGGFTHEGAPFSYRKSSGTPEGIDEVLSSYKVEGMTISFDIEEYAGTCPLVIDPFSTYYGGSGNEVTTGMVIDSQDAVILCGRTISPDFPVLDAWQDSLGLGAGSEYDAFLLRFDRNAKLRWATFFGGSAFDGGISVTSDLRDDVLLAGIAASDDLPVHAAVVPVLNGRSDGFLARFDSSGTRIWASYTGTTTSFSEIGVDSAGHIYGMGDIAHHLDRMREFPTKRAFQEHHLAYGSGAQYFFYQKLTPDGELLFSSFFGKGAGNHSGGLAVATDGQFAIAGQTTSDNFPLKNAWQSRFAGGTRDAFLALFDSSGQPIWSTLYGGNSTEMGEAVIFDTDGNLLMAGKTASTDLPVPQAFQDSLNGLNGQYDAFLAKFDRSGNLFWATYFGGSEADGINNQGIASDSADTIYLSGITTSPDMPVHNAVFPTRPEPASVNDIADAFVVAIDSSGARKWSTYLGGSRSERGSNIACDMRGNIYVAGSTMSNDFPVYNPWQRDRAAIHKNDYDLFITRFSSDGRIPVTLAQISARRVAGGVELHWLTESEVNVYGFMIERDEASGCAPEWTDIAFVSAEGGNMMRQTYRHVDGGASDEAREYRYRLRMIDLDGSHEYSPVVHVAPVTPTHRVAFDAAYPSPARDWVTLRFTLPDELPVTLRVHDITGRELVRLHDAELLARGTHSSVFPVSDWRSGLYLATLTAGDAQIVRRVMVMR